MVTAAKRRELLSEFHPAVRTWFDAAFAEPTLAQRKGAADLRR